MKRLLLAATVAAALWIAACSSGSTTVLPPPTGKYSLSSLNGTYSFATNGEVFASGATTATPLARVGSFVANGSGDITGGVEDANEVSVGVSPAITITGGSYTVNADGRGTLTLQLGQSSINFGITLTSTNDGLMIDETFTQAQASTGSGNFIKQDPTKFTAPVPSPAGTYVFDFAGFDVNQAPDSIVGQFSVGAGVVTNGVQDENDNGNIPLTPTPVSFVGNMAQDPLNTSTLGSSGRGVAQFNGIQYVFYIVDGSRVRFLSTTGGMLSGDAVVQTSAPATLNSGFVFLVGGTSGAGGVTRIGRFTANGSSVTSVLMDTNNNGMFHQTGSSAVTAASVSLDSANPGRGILTFTDSGLSVTLTFVFYLSSANSGVIQDVSQSQTKGATDVADGSITAQTVGPLAPISGTTPYALNWSGLSLQNGGSFATQDEEDLVGQATISSLALTGAADIFQFQNINGPQFDNLVGGSIVINGDGTGGDGKRSTMLVKLTKNGSTAPVNVVVYFASPQLAFFANTSTSSTRIIAGILKLQQ
jgi:hypothetical protein